MLIDLWGKQHVSRVKCLPQRDISCVATWLQKWIWLVDTTLYTQKDEYPEWVHVCVIPSHTLQIDALCTQVCPLWAYSLHHCLQPVQLADWLPQGKFGNYGIQDPVDTWRVQKGQLLGTFDWLHCHICLTGSIWRKQVTWYLKSSQWRT